MGQRPLLIWSAVCSAPQLQLSLWASHTGNFLTLQSILAGSMLICLLMSRFNRFFTLKISRHGFIFPELTYHLQLVTSKPKPATEDGEMVAEGKDVSPSPDFKSRPSSGRKHSADKRRTPITVKTYEMSIHQPFVSDALYCYYTGRWFGGYCLNNYCLNTYCLNSYLFG